RQNPYNIPIEILYTVAPVVIVAALFGFSISTQDAATALSDDPDVVVDVVGFQWQWRFTYPDEGVSLVGTPESGPPELVLPIGETVRFNLVADDVVHSFWVPNFLEKRDLIPGVDNALDITPNRLGTYPGRCAEFCGLDHWRMGFTVRVVEADEFAAWAADAADAGG
nr:cytochrome C oxidase subunit II [Actinomycetota bacterium]